MDEKHFMCFRTLLSSSNLSSDGLLKKNLEVKHLKKKDIPRATKTVFNANKEDLLSEYIRDTPDAKHLGWYNRIERIQLALFISQWVRRKWGLTIDHGQAILCTVPAPEGIKHSKLEWYYSLAVRALDFVGKTRQQRKRLNLAGKALFKLITDTMGGDVKTTRSIAALAAIPELQGTGCDALVTVVKNKADSEARSVWVLSSIPRHEEFFQYEGFDTVAETFIGVDDPTWDRPPVRVALLIRARKN